MSATEIIKELLIGLSQLSTFSSIHRYTSTFSSIHRYTSTFSSIHRYTSISLQYNFQSAFPRVNTKILLNIFQNLIFIIKIQYQSTASNPAIARILLYSETACIIIADIYIIFINYRKIIK